MANMYRTTGQTYFLEAYQGKEWIVSDEGTAYYVPDTLSGVSPDKILAGSSILGVNGSVPVITAGDDPAQGVGQWGDGALAVYPSEGYRKGGAGAGEIKVTTAQLQSAEPDLTPSNIRAGVAIYGVTGSMPAVAAPKEVSGYYTLSPSSSASNQVRFTVTLTVPTGKIMAYMRMEPTVSSVNYIQHTSTSGVLTRCFGAASNYNRNGVTSGSEYNIGSITTSISNSSFDSSTGAVSMEYRVLCSSGTISLVGAGTIYFSAGFGYL